MPAMSGLPQYSVSSKADSIVSAVAAAIAQTHRSAAQNPQRRSASRVLSMTAHPLLQFAWCANHRQKYEWNVCQETITARQPDKPWTLLVKKCGIVPHLSCRDDRFANSAPIKGYERDCAIKRRYLMPDLAYLFCRPRIF